MTRIALGLATLFWLAASALLAAENSSAFTDLQPWPAHFAGTTVANGQAALQSKWTGTETNPGRWGYAVTADERGPAEVSATLRIEQPATQFAFLPRCIVVPRDAPVTLRFVSPDVIHGILVTGTNVNTMVIPGYVAQVHTTFTETGDLLMPCHEFCGMGHSQMWATVRVVEPQDFKPDAQGRANCAQP